MRKYLPVILFLFGISLLLYPPVCQSRSAAAQARSIAYWETADTETDLLGTLIIPSLSLSLPIRAGTTDAVLAEGVGLLEGSFFDTHAVLCGHRGLPESRLFTDLDHLEPGDCFTVTLKQESHSYKVIQILVTEPEDTQYLQPEAGKELCTLLTCTPYGINSHRLLIRGQRICTCA